MQYLSSSKRSDTNYLIDWSSLYVDIYKRVRKLYFVMETAVCLRANELPISH